MNHLQLESLLNQKLSPELIKDYCPNGLQVEGRTEVKKIITGVTASIALIEKAIATKADAILVHHGYFWKGESESIRGMKGARIRALIKNDINMYAYHLPLDVHPEIGNNTQLAKLLNIQIEGGLESTPQSVALYGSLNAPVSAIELSQRIEAALNRKPLYIAPDYVAPETDKLIKTVGWCTGGGQHYIELAAAKGLDAFISGEVSERTTYSAREQQIHFFNAGHHATERYGVKALGEWLEKEHGFEVEFVDIDNPV